MLGLHIEEHLLFESQNLGSKFGFCEEGKMHVSAGVDLFMLHLRYHLIEDLSAIWLILVAHSLMSAARSRCCIYRCCKGLFCNILLPKLCPGSSITHDCKAWNA